MLTREPKSGERVRCRTPNNREIDGYETRVIGVYVAAGNPLRTLYSLTGKPSYQGGRPIRLFGATLEFIDDDDDLTPLC